MKHCLFVTGNLSEADDLMLQHHQMGQDIIDNLVILDAIVPTFHDHLRSSLLEIFPHLLCALRSRFAVIRQLAAQAFATICDISITDAMRFVIDNIVPLLGDPLLTDRQGAVEVIYCVLFNSSTFSHFHLSLRYRSKARSESPSLCLIPSGSRPGSNERLKR